MESLGSLPPADGKPQYLVFKRFLKDQILTGRLRPEEQIPPELNLCRHYHLARKTVHRSIDELSREGFLHRHRGRGTFVRFRRSTRQRKLIGMMIRQQGPLSSGFDEITSAAEEAAAREGYQVVQVETAHDSQRVLDLVAQLNEMKVVGTLCAPVQGPFSDRMNNEALEALIHAGQKVVLVDSDVPGPFQGKISCVTSQNFEAADELTRHLMAHGCKRIAFLRGPAIRSGDLRFEGFKKAMRDGGLEIRPEYSLRVAADQVEFQGNQEVDVFKAMREPPEAVVCLHDLIALNMLKHCKERGVRVPEDMAIVGFDDLPVSKHADPPLTTMRQAFDEMGRRAMRILLKHLQDQTIAPIMDQLPCQLIERKSCGAHCHVV
ncbi:MAG: GntR family transcriptional regulator [Verrucomicrobiae bacterium]|nr:GntR family transcriptional regulator [Verrucomicrobiae bacterium]